MKRPLKPNCLFFSAALVLPLLASCGLPAASGRSMGRVMAMSATPADAQSHAAAIDALREIQAAQDEEILTPPAAGSMR
jgi:hypothetical protein